MCPAMSDDKKDSHTKHWLDVQNHYTIPNSHTYEVGEGAVTDDRVAVL